MNPLHSAGAVAASASAEPAAAPPALAHLPAPILEAQARAERLRLACAPCTRLWSTLVTQDGNLYGTSYFTAAERERARGLCACGGRARGCCQWLLPVPFDLVWGRTRSRAVTVLVFWQLALVIVMFFFSTLGLAWAPTCYEAASLLRALDGQPPLPPPALRPDSLVVLYLLGAGMAASAFSSPPWLLLGAAASLVYLLALTAAETQHCFALTYLTGNRGVLGSVTLLLSALAGFSDESAVPASVALLSTGATSAALGLLDWLATLVVALRLLVLAGSMLHAVAFVQSHQLDCKVELGGSSAGSLTSSSGAAALSASATGSAKDAAQAAAAETLQMPAVADHDVEASLQLPEPAQPLPPQPQPQTQPTAQSQPPQPPLYALPPLHQALASARLLAEDAAQDVLERLRDVPLRVLAAFLVSSAALLVLSTALVAWSGAALQAMQQLRPILAAIFDPSKVAGWVADILPLLPPELQSGGPEAQKFVTDAVRILGGVLDAVAGVVQDVAQYLPYGLVAVTVILLGAVWQSLYPVSEHVRWLRLRYATARAPHAAPLDAALDAASAPSLVLFANYDGTMFLFTHLVSVTVAYILAVLLVALLVVAYLAVTRQGFGAAIAILSAIFYKQLLSLAYRFGPRTVYWGVVAPIAALTGTKGALLATPARLAVGTCIACYSLCADGPHVLFPRLFTLLDVVGTVLVAPVVGVFEALSRVLLGTVWGVVRLAQLHHPLLPIAQLDRGFMTYGGALRLASQELLDEESAALVPAAARGAAWK